MREEPHFKGITFIHNNVSNNGLHIIFSKLPFCPYFEYLHLTCETLNDVALEDFCQYLPSSHLRKVGFCEISCTNPSLQRLLSLLPVACSLKSLHLEKLNLNAQTLQVLSTILNATNIAELYFPGNPFGDEGIEVLTNCLSSSRKIQVLDFSNCAITWRGAVGLSHIVSNLETLKRLELYGNSLGCEGLRFLSQALQHSTLKHLDISECDIGDAGVRYLSESLPGSKLQYLGIDSNFITDEGMIGEQGFVSGIQDALHLSVIYLNDHPQISDYCFQELLKAVSWHPRINTFSIEDTEISDVNKRILENKLKFQNSILVKNLLTLCTAVCCDRVARHSLLKLLSKDSLLKIRFMLFDPV